MRVAYFVTPHGFGHASRAAAVIEALARRIEHVSFEIVTTVPKWFFSQSLSVPFEVLPVACDVGLIQTDPVREDVEATVTALDRFWSALPGAVEAVTSKWRGSLPDLVVADISPLGLEAARQAGVPSALIENFTWDWIYRAYEHLAPEISRFGDRYQEVAASAGLHIQCRPACTVDSRAIQVAPVSRGARMDPRRTRRALGLAAADSRPLVLLTLGGLGWTGAVPTSGTGCALVTLGGIDSLQTEGDLIRLPNRSPVYPPDLICAADVVIAKLGYSTVVECFQAGSRLGYLRRPVFPESPILERFVQEKLSAREVRLGGRKGDRTTIDWPAELARLLELPAGERQRTKGADEIAEVLLEFAGKSS